MAKEKQILSNIEEKFIKGDIFSDKCPSREALKVLTSRWGLLILLSLYGKESLRFSQLREKIQGISEKMLSQNLKKLEAYKLVSRFSHGVVPPVVEYSLTDYGIEFSQKAIELTDWIEENITNIYNR
ncbi:MAG: transcriptional regulator [Halobacteriovoraceae bacterium]|nr:transcriptional regulator [Halobacteriovoraceae bacterium]|tara:strand:+ start:7598 stop:7978 length:381 start_codon:yes stop_codon:yes gene_type:complete